MALFIGEGEACVPPSYGAGGVEVLHNENPRLGEPTSAQWEEFWGMGDVNMDGYINDADIALLQAAYGSTPESPNWDPRCDLNGDEKIDLYDVSAAARNYGLNIWDYFGIAREQEPDYMPLILAGGVFAVVLVGLFLFK